MEIATPLSPVYYFEITPRSVRLLYFVPRKPLAVLLRRRIVRKEILQDFPYGLEVEVSDSEFRLVHDQYGFIPPLAPKLVWDAFRGLWLHSQKGQSFGSGIIDARSLESYGRKLQPVVTAFELEARRRGVSATRDFDPATERQLEQPPVWSTMRDSAIKSIRPKDAIAELPLEEQKWSKVQMSHGLTAAEAFSTIQRLRTPAGRGKRGNRS